MLDRAGNFHYSLILTAGRINFKFDTVMHLDHIQSKKSKIFYFNIFKKIEN